MNFPTYNAFRVAMQHLIEGDDHAQGTFSTDTLDILIGLGENRVYRDLHASTMVSALSLTVTSNAVTLPAGLLELRQIYFSGDAPMEVVPLDRLRRLAVATTSGTVRYAAQDGDTLTFWPAAADATTVLGSYYARPADLVTGTWANQKTFARYPEVFMFAGLCEAAPMVGEDGRLPMWEAKYRQALSDARQDERVRVYGSGRLRTRTS